MNTDERLDTSTLEKRAARVEGQAGIALDDRIRVGQMLAQIELEEIIGKTQRWAKAGRLDRGLSLSLPYFDDRSMEIGWRELLVIPRGRIPFLPGFVVMAAREDIQRVATEGGRSAATREHLIAQLHALELAFAGGAPAGGGPLRAKD